MRIREIHQRAFGRFTEHQLTFGSAGDAPVPGLHIVHGPNEAGKTTTLHAIRYGLYGIPDLRNDPRTYDFLHRKPDLRIGMVIETDEGELIRFTRRKKSGETCFDFEDAAADSATQQKLHAVLRGVDRDLFTRKYGIDYPTLREGGEGLASEGESVGESLFAAATGIVGIHTTLRTLAAQAEALLKDTGRSGAIHDATKRFNDADSAVRRAIKAGRKWHPKQAELERTNEELGAIQENIIKTSAALERAKAINEAVPTVIERASRVEEIAALGPLIITWSIEREQERVQLRRIISETEGQISEATKELEAREADEQELMARADEGMTEIAGRVQPLSERIAEYVAARASAPQLQSEQQEAVAKVTNACRQVRADADPAQSRDLLPTLPNKTHARALLEEYSGIQREVLAAKLSVDKAEDALEAFSAQDEPLAASPEKVDFLSVALDSVEKVDTARLAQLEHAALAKEQQLSSKVAALPRSTHSLRQLISISAPLEATIEDFDHRIREAETKAKQAREALAEARAQLDEQESRLKELAQNQPIPSAEELGSGRSVRDSTWRRIRSSWLNEDVPGDGEPISAGSENALADAYEAAVAKTDRSADRRTAAGAITGQITATETLRDASTEDIAHRTAGLQVFESELEAVRRQWQDLWSVLGVEPGTVAEMRAWLSELGDIRRASDELSSNRGEANSLRERVERARRDLYNALGAAQAQPPAEDVSVEVLEERARQLIDTEIKARETARDRAVQRKGLEGTKRTAKHHQERAADDLRGWALRWSAAAVAIGLPADASADAGEGALQAFEALGSALGHLDAATVACEQNTQTVRSFVTDTQSLLESVGGALADAFRNEPAEHAVRELLSRAESSQTAIAGLNALRPAISTVKRNQVSQKLAIAAASRALTKLATESGLSSAEDLDAAATLWDTRENLRAEIRDYDSNIIRITKMAPDEVIASFGDTPTERLPIRISEIREELNDLSEKKHAKESDVRDLHSQISELKVDAQHELALADRADARADLERLATEYTRLKLEFEILSGYLRDKAVGHIGPALTRAGELFQELTCGNYNGVTQDVDDDDKPVIKVLPKVGSSMGRKGLSTGTADQLYLALRLASIYQQLDQPGQEPLPFIVDDILTSFDDERSAATMRALAQLATRTQVIFFTHHQHLVDLARDQVPADALHVTSLT
jgi:uncharacterized protein YhaN